MSNNTWLESLCQHYGHPLTGCRVRATDRAAARSSKENGDGADVSFKRPQVRALDFLHTDVTCEGDFQMHGIENASLFTLFFRCPPQT